MSGVSYLPVKGEYHDNFLTAQAVARGRLDRDMQKSLFDRLDWLDALHRIALRDKTPLLLRAHDGDADVWMPLMQLAGGQFGALANWYNFTWRPIFGGTYEEVTRMALLRQLALTAHDHGRRLTLAPLPDEDHSASELAAAFEQAGWIVERSQCDECHYLTVGGRSFDEYWETRPGQLRNAVKRRIREQFRLRQTALPASQYVVRLSIAITTKDVGAVIAEWTSALEHDIAKLAARNSVAPANMASPGVNA